MKIHFRENWLIFYGIWGEAELILRIWGANENSFSTFRELRNFLSGIRGNQCIIFRDQGSTDPQGGGALWHAQALNTHTLSGSPTTTEISTVWKNRYSTELIDSSTETYTRMTNIVGGSRGGDRGVRTPPPPPGKSHK